LKPKNSGRCVLQTETLTHRILKSNKNAELNQSTSKFKLQIATSANHRVIEYNIAIGFEKLIVEIVDPSPI